MSKGFVSGLESSYILSLTKTLGVAQDVSDQMTTFLSDFRLPDGELLVETSGPDGKDSEPINAVTEDFLSSFGLIFWPPSGNAKDQKLRYTDDKDRIADYVSTIFQEKVRLYRQHLHKDLNVDTKGNTPQPPQDTPPDSSKDVGPEAEVAQDAAVGDLSGATGATAHAEESATATKAEPPASNDQEDEGAIHVLSSRSRGGGRASASARTSEPAASTMKQSPLNSPAENLVDDSNRPYKFASVPEYKKGINDALERTRDRGENLIGAIQFVRTTLNETVIRDAVTTASSQKRVGNVRLTQINDRTMAWVYEKTDSTCLWVKPYKGKVINGVVRYSGWTGEDSVFTDYPVIYGIIPKDTDTPAKVGKETPSSSKIRTAPRLSTGTAGSKIVNLKLGRRNTDGKGTPTAAAESSDLPAYINGVSWTMERAKQAVQTGHRVEPPCSFCVDAGYPCMMSDRGRTCGFCIATLRSASDCEKSRQAIGIEATDHEPTAKGSSLESPDTQPILTHSGRVSKRPTRDNYVDRSENDSDSALSSASIEEPVRGPGSSKLRRKSSAVPSTTTPSLKRPRPTSLTIGDNEYSLAAPATGSQPSGTSGQNASNNVAATSLGIGSEAWFSFTPDTPSNPDLQSKVVRAKELTTVNAFFDAALKAWRYLGGSAEPGFSGVDVAWPERKMVVEWRDERDWERMMTMIGRAKGDEHGEVEVSVKYRVGR